MRSRTELGPQTIRAAIDVTVDLSDAPEGSQRPVGQARDGATGISGSSSGLRNAASRLGTDDVKLTGNLADPRGVSARQYDRRRCCLAGYPASPLA